jgi:hypothetical protein
LWLFSNDVSVLEYIAGMLYLQKYNKGYKFMQHNGNDTMLSCGGICAPSEAAGVADAMIEVRISTQLFGDEAPAGADKSYYRHY